MKKTIVFGATPNPARFAYKAAHQLKDRGYPIVPLGIKKGEVAGEEILDLRGMPELNEVDTVTLYVGPQNQKVWIDYILSLRPKRIIFNPGTENSILMNKAKKQGIEVVPACTLVMLAVGNY